MEISVVVYMHAHIVYVHGGWGGGAIPAPLPLPSLKSISRKLLHSDTSTYNFRLEKIMVNIQNILKSWVFKNSADHQKVFV